MHYVSPSVWAWRPKRIFKIDSTTHWYGFPTVFEKRSTISITLLVSSLATRWRMTLFFEPSKREALELLGLDQDKQWLAVLPGSRGGEMSLIAQPFIETSSQRIKQKYPLILTSALRWPRTA
ncbi:hypothetical protein O9929_09100 [Vibrio lentus]|nr:hypothetical protein [Vibrio lentus]